MHVRSDKDLPLVARVTGGPGGVVEGEDEAARDAVANRRRGALRNMHKMPVIFSRDLQACAASVWNSFTLQYEQHGAPAGNRHTKAQDERTAYYSTA